MGKSCWMASFSHTNPLNISEIRTATKFSVCLNELQTSNLAVLLIFFLLFHKVPGRHVTRSAFWCIVFLLL